MGHGIEGFKRGMGEIGEGECRLEHFRRAGESRSHVAIVARHVGGRLFRGFLIGSKNFRRPTLFGLALIPFDSDEIAALDRDPHVFGNDRNPARNLHHVDDALERLSLRRIKGLDRGAEFRRMDHHRRRHAGQLDVDGVGQVPLVFGFESKRFRSALPICVHISRGFNGISAGSIKPSVLVAISP